MNTLTTEEKRDLIAQSMGWKVVAGPMGYECWMSPQGRLAGRVSDHLPFYPPDYFSDLNACADMERSLEGEMRHDYVRTLCGMMNGWEMMPDFTTTFATAAQRAEAFGLTMGLWT